MSMAAHLGATAFVASQAGAPPTLVSSTGIIAPWDNLRDAGAIAAGAIGSLVSATLAVGGWLVVRHHRGRPGLPSVIGWFLFSFNAWLLSAWTVASPLLGIGGWQTIADGFANRGPVRASIVAAGLFLLALTRKEAAPSLAWMAGNGKAEVRRRRARMITRTGWVAAVVITAAAAMWVPIGAARSILVVVGISAATLPMVFVARSLGEHPVPGEALTVRRSPGVIVLGVVATLLFVGVLGRGLTLL